MRFAVIGDSGPLAGSAVTADEVKQAGWSRDHAQAVGIAIKDGTVVPMKTHGPASGVAYLPLKSGVVVLELKSDNLEAAEMRMLAALIGLVDLLFDRRRAT